MEPPCGERDIVVTTSVWCMCVVGVCFHPDYSEPLLVYLFKYFKIIWHSCSSLGEEVPFETFVEVG